MNKNLFTRRSFIKTLGGASLILPNIITSAALGAGEQPAASNRIVMGAVGIGRQGGGDLGQFLNDPRIQVVAVCDVQTKNRNAAKAQVDGRYKNQDCKAYVDYRELIARPDIDMILCATPDHWHAQVSIDAMKSGKDVYCEKPLTLTIAEGRKMVDTARSYGRVLSCGSQRVIGDYGKLACAARSGRYGQILEGWALPGIPPRPCYLPEEPIPADTIDWDMWLGPAPWAPYNPRRCGGSYDIPSGQGFRSWSDYSGGGMTDWGGHKFGALLHGMGLDSTGPTEIIPADGKSSDHIIFGFANGMKIHVKGEIKYVCEAGEVKANPNLPVPPGLRWYEGGAKTPITDLINCVQNRRRPFQDVEYAHRTATLCHLGNISYLLNRKLRWDPVKEDFIGDAEASRLVTRHRRGPWQI